MSESLIRLAEIASYIPERRESNFAKAAQFETDEQFIREKIGVHAVARRADNEETSDMCVRAFARLSDKCGVAAPDLQCLVVCTQNPDGHGIPHTSAVVHGKLAAPTSCAAFDVSLGCSGYVYGLSIVSSFMAANDLATGVLFTCDPYSKILNPSDKNTALLFGDAAAATLLVRTDDAAKGWRFAGFKFGTDGGRGGALHNRSGLLSMDGRAVFNFSATAVPVQVSALLEAHSLLPDAVDLFLFHQGSRFIVDTLRKRMNLPPERVPSNLMEMGNSVSSSIPLLLEPFLHGDARRILLSGFGVGLSWASCLIEKELAG